jgi:hypothetical protein
MLAVNNHPAIQFGKGAKRAVSGICGALVHIGLKRVKLPFHPQLEKSHP